LVQCAQGQDPASLTFARLEQLCSNAASIICGATLADPSSMRPEVTLAPALIAEAAAVARRTGDGFGKALADREHTVLAWPWDHVATSVAWTATKSGQLEVETLGRSLFALAAGYSLLHRDQLAAVINVWDAVSAGLRPESARGLAAMGQTMFATFEQLTLAPA
jgi:hypothetical protein